MPDFSVQNNFPMAAVIQAAQENANRLQKNQAYGQQSLISGLQSIGQVGQSLLDRRRTMAQAMAGAKLYAASPEGQQLLGTNQVTSGPQGQPVTMNQTAQGGVDQDPTSNKSGVDMQTLATAFMGESPSNLLTQMFERQKVRSQLRFEQQKLAEEQATRRQQIAQTGELTKALIGVRGQQVTGEAQSNIRNQITALEGKKAQAIKDFPELTGTFLSGILPAGSNAKQEAAFNDYKQTQAQIDQYNRQLYSGGSAASNSPAAHMSTADLLAIINQGTSP